jgi:hypothetical protein
MSVFTISAQETRPGLSAHVLRAASFQRVYAPGAEVGR